MDDNELTIYILQQLRQGVPEQSIRAVLAQNGWPQPLVDRAFSMVQQARPHMVDPQLPAQPATPTPQEAELPTPSENPYPVLEGEKRRELRSRLRRFLTFLIVLVVLAAIGGAMYYFVFREKPASKNAENPAKISVDDERKEAVNRLASELLDYYKANGTYPTFDQINTPEFSKSKEGFDISRYRDPEWNAKNTACATADGRTLLAASRSEGCIFYRVTAPNGSDCDAVANSCTRVVMNTTLENQKPFVVALDRNKRE